MPYMPETRPESPNFPPRDLELAKQHRIQDLQAVVDDPAASTLRKQAVQHELQHILDFGYAYPFNTGWPVAGRYNDAEQQRRIAEVG